MRSVAADAWPVILHAHGLGPRACRPAGPGVCYTADMRFNVRKMLILMAYVAAVLALLSTVVVRANSTRPSLLIAFLFAAAVAWIYEFARAS